MTTARTAFVRAIRALATQQGVPLRVLAAVSSRKPGGVSDEMVTGKLLKEDGDYPIEVGDVEDWSRKLGPGVWDAWFAMRGLPFGAVPVSMKPAAAADVVLAAGEAVRESGEAVAVAMGALQGGVTLAEKRKTRREIDEAVSSLQALGAAMEAA